jgi:hypothetical protein
MSKAKSKSYVLGPRDKNILLGARSLLWKIARSRLVSEEQLKRVARVLQALERLPVAPDPLDVSITLVGPERTYGEHVISHRWAVEVDGESIKIWAGGSFYRESTGGDSFTSMSWSADPGWGVKLIDYLRELQIVDDAIPFEPEISRLELAEGGYSLFVSDGDEEIQGPPSKEANEPRGDIWDLVGPTDHSEELLFAQAQLETGLAKGRTHLNPPSTCELCKRGLAGRGVFVDGRMRGSLMWAAMCSGCFLQCGEGMGRGDGQLFARRADGSWLMLDGFPADDTEEDEPLETDPEE